MTSPISKRKAAAGTNCDDLGFASTTTRSTPGKGSLTDKEAEYDAIWKDIDRVEEKIMDTPAHSVAGIAVKLRLVAYYANPGKEGPEGLDWDQRIMFNVLADAERLVGRASS